MLQVLGKKIEICHTSAYQRRKAPPNTSSFTRAQAHVIIEPDGGSLAGICKRNVGFRRCCFTTEVTGNTTEALVLHVVQVQVTELGTISSNKKACQYGIDRLSFQLKLQTGALFTVSGITLTVKKLW